MHSIRNVTQFIYDLEQELHLVEATWDGHYVYSFLRTRLVTEIEKQLTLIGQPHDIAPRRTRWQRYFDFFYYDFLFLLHRGNYDLLVVEHERQIQSGDTYIDIYSDAFVQQRKKQERVMCIRAFPKRQNKENRGKRIFTPQGFLDRFDRQWKHGKQQHPFLSIFDEASRRIHAQFGTAIDLNAMLVQQWPAYLRSNLRFRRWLRVYQPKEVALVVGYYHYDLIAACKHCHIPVSELQHGIIDYHHSGYSYPHHVEVPYFVDRLYVFGAYWTHVVQLPLQTKQIVELGFLYFRQQTAQCTVKRKETEILVISQGTIGSQLVDMIHTLALAYPMYHFTYKLHPGEFLQAYERYPLLADMPENVSVAKNEVPLYERMQMAHTVIGAYSTAVYEALALGCQCLLLEVDGVQDYMSYLIEHNAVGLFHDTETFAQAMTQPMTQLKEAIF